MMVISSSSDSTCLVKQEVFDGCARWEADISRESSQLVASLRSSTGTGPGIYRRGTRSDYRHQTVLLDEAKEVQRRAATALGAFAHVASRSRLSCNGTGTVG